MRGLLAILIALLLFSPAAIAEDAAALFKTKCSPCHGANGDGQSPMGKKLGVRALTSPEVQKLTDEALVEVMSKGKGKMPAFQGKLTAEQMKLIVSHIRGLAKK